MYTHTHSLGQDSPGNSRHLTSLHFGREARVDPFAPGAPRQHGKVYIQASLHADEIPGMLVAQHLRSRLAGLEQAGCIPGEIVLVPVANPIGLAQALQGTLLGRFDLPSGHNFNRFHRNLSDDLIARLDGKLSSNPQENRELVRQTARELIVAGRSKNANEELKKHLQMLAIDADIMLDLHCDDDAVMHLYAGTPHADTAALLGRCLGAHAILLATESGDQPFDESCGRIWWDLQAKLGPVIPLAGFSATVELRGKGDVDDVLAQQDADALLQFLVRQGHVLLPKQVELLQVPGIDFGAIGKSGLPAALCLPTPLEGMAGLSAPCGGVVVFHQQPGAMLAVGDLVAELVDPETGERHRVEATVPGKMFARTTNRFALRGMDIARVAGAQAFRTGKLLSD